MDTKKVMPRSFRCSLETVEKIKGIASEIGGNQEQALAKLIECYEYQDAKSKVTTRSEDIEKFEALTSTISEMYLASIENAHNATDVAKSEFRLLLNSKDKEIISLQEKAETALKECKKSEGELQKLIDEKASLQRENEQLGRSLEHEKVSFERQKEEYEKVRENNQKLTDSINSVYAEKLILSEQLKDLQEENKMLNEFCDQNKEQMQALQEQVADFSEKYRKLKCEYQEELKRDLDRQKEVLSLETEKNILQLEKDLKIKYEEKCHKLEAEKEKYKDLYIRLLEKDRT